MPSSLAVASVYFFCVPWFHCKDMNVCQFTNITHKTGHVNNYTRTISTPMKRYCIAEVYSNYATAIQNTLYVPFITQLNPYILTTCGNTINRKSVDRNCVLRLVPLFGSQITFGNCSLVLCVCNTWGSYLLTVLTHVCRLWTGKWVGQGGNLAALATSSDTSKFSLRILHNRWHECIQQFMHQIRPITDLY